MGRLHLVVLLCFCAITAYSQISSQVEIPPQCTEQKPVSCEELKKIDPSQVHPPVPINMPRVPMPADLGLETKGGKCRVSVIIDATGMPQDAHLLYCTDRGFGPASVAGVMRYRLKPATIPDGRPIPVMIRVDVVYSGYYPPREDEPPTKADAQFVLLPDGVSPRVLANGVYTLSKSFAPPNSPPAMTKFANKGFGLAAFDSDAGVGCVAELTINAKGKASDALIRSCDKPQLEDSALKSLLNSKFKPAVMNGKAVTVRGRVHLQFEGYGKD